MIINAVVDILKSGNSYVFVCVSADVSAKKIQSFRLTPKELVLQMQKSSSFINVELNSAGNIVGSNGSLQRFNANSNGYKPVVILSEITNKKGEKIGYVVANAQGKVFWLENDKALHIAKLMGIQNGKVVTREDGTEFISSIKGEYPLVCVPKGESKSGSSSANTSKNVTKDGVNTVKEKSSVNLSIPELAKKIIIDYDKFKSMDVNVSGKEKSIVDKCLELLKVSLLEIRKNTSNGGDIRVFNFLNWVLDLSNVDIQVTAIKGLIDTLGKDDLAPFYILFSQTEKVCPKFDAFIIENAKYFI